MRLPLFPRSYDFFFFFTPSFRLPASHVLLKEVRYHFSLTLATPPIVEGVLFFLGLWYSFSQSSKVPSQFFPENPSPPSIYTHPVSCKPCFTSLLQIQACYSIIFLGSRASCVELPWLTTAAPLSGMLALCPTLERLFTSTRSGLCVLFRLPHRYMLSP